MSTKVHKKADEPIPREMEARLVELVRDDAINSKEKLRQVVRMLMGGKTRQEFLTFVGTMQVGDDDDPPDKKYAHLSAPELGFWMSNGGTWRAIGDDWIRLFCEYDDITPDTEEQLLDLRLEAIDEDAGKSVRIFQPPEVNPKYSYRCARNDRDLNLFVELSHDEVEIQRVHSGLELEDRRALYERWMSWSARSFVYVAHRDQGRVAQVAVSIILPLTTSAGARIWRREIDAVELEEGDIHGGPGDAPCLLLDTWIVKPKEPKKGPQPHVVDLLTKLARPARVRRVGHELHGTALIPLHLGIFWDGERDVTVLVEPDSPRIAELLCKPLGFEGAPKGGCFRLCYSASRDATSKSLRTFKQHVTSMRGHPIVDLRD
jgi:hypothetical protein